MHINAPVVDKLYQISPGYSIAIHAFKYKFWGSKESNYHPTSKVGVPGPRCSSDHLTLVQAN